MNLLEEMISTRILEDTIQSSQYKKHIMSKYVMVNKKNSIIASRNKLDSLRLNYKFGVKEIDGNEALRAFMTRNIEKRMFKKVPLAHELQMLTGMITDVQRERVMKQSIEEMEEEES